MLVKPQQVALHMHRRTGRAKLHRSESRKGASPSVSTEWQKSSTSAGAAVGFAATPRAACCSSAASLLRVLASPASGSRRRTCVGEMPLSDVKPLPATHLHDAVHGEVHRRQLTARLCIICRQQSAQCLKI